MLLPLPPPPPCPSPLRLQRLEHLAAKFDHKATNIEGWIKDKDVQLERNDDIEGANLAEVMVRERERDEMR